jgi:hypothetical protein
VAVKYVPLFALWLFLQGCSSGDVRPNTPGLPSTPPPAPFKTGNIIFQVSLSGQGKAIQLATHSPYTHCGIIVTSEQLKSYYVLEAVQPVKLTPLEKWIERGEGGHYVIKQLKNDSMITNKEKSAFLSESKKYLGKDYDLFFDWSDDRIYCSELVWKLYKSVLGIEIGKLQKLKDFDLSNPVVQQKLKQRYGNNIPYEEQVISPAAIFDCPLLKTVDEK